jgi:hypothetical protein
MTDGVTGAGDTGQSMFVDRVSSEISERSSEDVLEELRTRLATLDNG